MKFNTCKQCGEQFGLRESGKGDHPSYCSKACKREATNERERERRRILKAGRTCKFCGSELGIKQPTYCGHDCYYRDKFDERSCVVCGVFFVPTQEAHQCCSRNCAKKKQAKTITGRKDTTVVKTCVICEQEFHPHVCFPNQETCSKYCKRRRDSIGKVKSGYRSKIRRRRQVIISATDSESIDRDAIFDRDGWVCQICGKKVRRNLKYPHPMSASLDHILPMSLGGSHTKANVQLAHLRCNIKKSDRGGAQLRLIGE